jgi:hypothetical protein
MPVCLQGDGFGAPASVQLADAREGAGHCCVVRPLRSFSCKELTLYAHFMRLPFFNRALITPDSTRSIHDATSVFLQTLQVRTT